MGVGSKIEWLHYVGANGETVPGYTWSPWRGCQKVSDGCKFCYAETLAKRNPAVLGEWGPNGARVVNKDWNAPRRWNRAAEKDGVRRRVFPSMCDWLEDRPELVEPRARFLGLILDTPNLDWLLLTKRPENFQKLVQTTLLNLIEGPAWVATDRWLQGGAITNVWLGVSVEDQATAEERIPILCETPAALRWVSYEPALGPVDFWPWLTRPAYPNSAGARGGPGGMTMTSGPPPIRWIVVGGESGPNARPFNLAWARKTIADCRDADVPVFVKQLGARPSELVVRLQKLRGKETEDGDLYFQPATQAVMLTHPKGGDPSAWPPDLRVRQMPGTANEGSIG